MDSKEKRYDRNLKTRPAFALSSERRWLIIYQKSNNKMKTIGGY